MPRVKIDPAVSRRAYAIAEKALKQEHATEFAALLDVAYESLGAESPRQRRDRVAAEAAEAAKARREAREAKEQAKIEEAIAFLKEKGVQIALDAEAVA
jgi:hypothetical protein